MNHPDRETRRTPGPCRQPIKWVLYLQGASEPRYLCADHATALRAQPGVIVRHVRPAPTIGLSGRPAMMSACQGAP